MSYDAIASALALDTSVSAGERLVVFSLASFANREHRAWPGTRIAAARAGLSRSSYLAARDSLANRGLLLVKDPGTGRGNSPIVQLTFVDRLVRVDADVNAPLFEAVLSYSVLRGSGRLLLATLAALADSDLVVYGVTTEELRAAAGMADTTYRRARVAVLDSQGAVVEEVGGGRARTNRWVVRDPKSNEATPVVVGRRRPARPAQARPLMAATRSEAAGAGEPVQSGSARPPTIPELSGVSRGNPGQNWTVSPAKGPELSGVSPQKPVQDRTLSEETPPFTPPLTPPPYARASREPQNQSTFPPNPRDRGSRPGSVSIVESYVSDRGRRRQRHLVVDLDAVRDQFRPPVQADNRDWELAQAELRRIDGESAFEVWLAQLQLAAVDSGGYLVLLAPEGTRAWVCSRFARVLNRAGAGVGRRLRLADDRESQLLAALAVPLPTAPSSGPASVFPQSIPNHEKEAV